MILKQNGMETSAVYTNWCVIPEAISDAIVENHAIPRRSYMMIGSHACAFHITDRLFSVLWTSSKFYM